MAEKKNYLIGNAEQLTRPVPPPSMNPQTNDIYTVQEIVQRLSPELKSTSEWLDKQSNELCPQDYAVAQVTMHPSYLSKGHFPRKLLRSIGARSICSGTTNLAT